MTSLAHKASSVGISSWPVALVRSPSPVTVDVPVCILRTA